MRNGRVVEHGDTERIFTSPRTDYTRQFLAAIAGRGLTRPGG